MYNGGTMQETTAILLRHGISDFKARETENENRDASGEPECISQ
jgi:hypothetical protein